MTPRNKTTTLKNLIEIWQMTLNDPKFDIKKSLDTLAIRFHCFYIAYSTVFLGFLISSFFLSYFLSTFTEANSS